MVALDRIRLTGPLRKGPLLTEGAFLNLFTVSCLSVC